MSTAFEIPLGPEAQKFNIQLAGVTYNLMIVWNEASNCWMLDIADRLEVPILQGIPLITGIDLLRQYEYLGFGGSLIVQTDHNPNAVPTLQNLGLTGRVYFVTEP
jgi:hypothetical protein